MLNKKIFFTSDTHFYHANIIKYENRPFHTVDEMNNTLIRNWNSVVTNHDDIYILGDFAFTDAATTIKLINKLNGNKFMIRGNHDRVLKDSAVAHQFAWVKDYYVLKVGELKIVLFHYPIYSWDCKRHGSIHLYGHIHSNKEDHHPISEILPNSYNVGVDVNNMTPIELEEILDILIPAT